MLLLVLWRCGSTDGHSHVSSEQLWSLIALQLAINCEGFSKQALGNLLWYGLHFYCTFILVSEIHFTVDTVNWTNLGN